MNRREVLSGLAAGLAGGLAGCVAPTATGDDRSARATPRSRPLPADLPVDEDELQPALHSAIPAIVRPRFAADWSGVEIARGGTTYAPRLTDGDAVIGVEFGGRARAYPLAVLNWHEVVNDVVEPRSTAGRTASDGRLGGPLLVTYCPSCGSGMAARRLVDGRETVFEVSHLLWRSNLVLRDRATGSLWSQLLAAAIRGPRTGEALDLVPSTLTTWGAWRGAHPDTDVLLPPPLSETVSGGAARDYTEGWNENPASVIGDDGGDGDLAPKTLVLGVEHGGVARAYPFGTVRAERVVNDVVGSLPVVVALAGGKELVAYDRRVETGTLSFAPLDGTFVRGGGSRWLLHTGRAVDGPHEGRRLARANALPPMFWFAWTNFHPDTAVYGRG